MGYPIKGSADYFKEGDYNIACAGCGRKMKASEAVKNWKGLYYHPEHQEPRQPQDFARGVKDIMTVPFAQPETDFFTSFCNINGQSAIPGFATPGCMVPGNAFVLPPDPLFGYCETLDGTFAVPGLADPGCAVPGRHM